MLSCSACSIETSYHCEAQAEFPAPGATPPFADLGELADSRECQGKASPTWAWPVLVSRTSSIPTNCSRALGRGQKGLQRGNRSAVHGLAPDSVHLRFGGTSLASAPAAARSGPQRPLYSAALPARTASELGTECRPSLPARHRPAMGRAASPLCRRSVCDAQSSSWHHLASGSSAAQGPLTESRPFPPRAPGPTLTPGRRPGRGRRRARLRSSTQVRGCLLSAATSTTIQAGRIRFPMGRPMAGISALRRTRAACQRFSTP